MLIKTETRVLEIGLSIWNGFPGVDCFDDLGGPDARDGHDAFELDDSGCSTAYIYTDEDADKLISWWESECESANRGEDGDGLQGLTEDEIASGDSWVLSVEDVTTEWGFGEDLTGDSSIPTGRDASAAYEQYVDSLALKYNVSPVNVQYVVYRHPEDLDQFKAICLMCNKARIKELQLDRMSSDADE